MIGERLTLTVEGLDDPVTVTYSAVDLRAYEAAFDVSVLSTPRSLTMLTWLGWHAAERTGAINGDLAKYADFDRRCVDLRLDRDEEDKGARPIKSGRGGAPSAP